jgi:hypothetical protein
LATTSGSDIMNASPFSPALPVWNTTVAATTSVMYSRVTGGSAWYWSTIPADRAPAPDPLPPASESASSSDVSSASAPPRSASAGRSGALRNSGLAARARGAGSASAGGAAASAAKAARRTARGSMVLAWLVAAGGGDGAGG